VKIYEWNILFDRFRGRTICVFSHSSQIYNELFPFSQLSSEHHPDVCDMLLIDYQFLKSNKDKNLFGNLFQKINQDGCLGIVEGVSILRNQ